MAQSRIRGTTISWQDSGTGKALLLLHAFPLDAGMWQPQLAGLSGEFRVIAMDARGFGGSADRPDVLGMDVIADDAAALLRELGIDRAVICGLSMGGYAALEMFRRHPQLFRALVLSDTRAGADDEAGKANREKFARNAIENGASWVAGEMTPKLLRKGADAAVAEAVRNMILRQPPAAVAAASRGMALRADSFETLPRIACPTLVIVGAEDTLTPPAEAKRLSDGIPGARQVEIPGAGHLSNLEAPAAFNAAIAEFMRALAGP